MTVFAALAKLSKSNGINTGQVVESEAEDFRCFFWTPLAVRSRVGAYN